jgi:translation initiation factor 2D
LIKIDYNLTPLLKPTESHIISLPRDKLLERLLDSSSSYYTISTGTETQTRKGKPPKIHIVLEKRQGRKTVTRFSGLEAFFINPNELAEELRNTCATSASVGGLLGSSPKQPVMEVMIQGPQATAVIEALEKRGVKKTFILLEDKRK